MKSGPIGRGLVLLLPCLATRLLVADVRVTEILYHPAQGEDSEYVEIHNDGAAPADLTGWVIRGGIEFDFEDGTFLAPHAYAVICADVDALRRAYPSIPPEAILGRYSGLLGNGGGEFTISNASLTEGEVVAWDDEAPWDPLADGYGASLERVCLTAPATVPENWRASAVPTALRASGGTPGGPGPQGECPPAMPAKPRIFISEILYHAVLEESLVERHEFVEIHNDGPGPVALDGWRLVGDIRFAFPAGSSIGPGEYRVIAKDRAALAAVASYGLAEADILGDYEGELDNGRGRVAIVAQDGRGIDAVAYEDQAPWPAAADALGAEEEWLPKEILPLEDHRYRGRSLERVSFDFPSREVANWAPSPLDGATPGRPNASARAVPLPVVVETTVEPLGAQGPLIYPTQEVIIRARFSPAAPAGAVEIESFVDDVMGGKSTTPTALPMGDDGNTGGDLHAGDGEYTAVLPAQKANAIVRWRIRADRGAGVEQVAPRLDDPNAWNAYFVNPVVQARTRLYHVFISPANWGRMWTNIQGGRASGCNVNPNWDAEVPAVFVHEGVVRDVFVRYQGSRWNRAGGPTISPWAYPRPSTGPLLALSWRIAFPRYSQLEGKGAIILNKLTQGCPGYNAGVGFRLYEEADLPGVDWRFIRFHVNGGYYHYMLELEHPDESLVARYNERMALKYPERPMEEVGHLFKAMGCNCDEGPWGWGDERALVASCGYTKEQRYAATYERKTHRWADNAEFVKLIEDLNAARKAGVDAMRAYFEENYDVDLLLSYVAIVNWSVPFDDMFQNHFLYQRRSDGKWLLFPWDLDQNFGEWKGAAASLYMGMSGDPDNRSGWWNYLKDAFLRSFKEEYEDRLFILNNTVLHPDNVSRLIDEVTAAADVQEATSAPGGVACSFPGRAASFRAFAVQRHDIVNTRLAGVAVDAGSSQTVFVGSTVQFDATASSPDEGPDATYEWDNGMTGEKPTHEYAEPGEYVVTLTVTVRGVGFTDTVTITVLPLPDRAFKETGGQVAMEAESFFMNERHDAANTWWEADTASPGFSGASYMQAMETRRQTFLSKYAATAPELRYAIVFDDPGTYRVWVRALCVDTGADSCFVGVDGLERAQNLYQNFAVDPASFLWSGDTRTSGPQLLEVVSPGLHVFSVWVRESRQIVDKIVLVKDLEWVPADAGPSESPTVPVGPSRGFIRGDANDDGKINVTDAVAVLLHLFAGAPLVCEDPGDLDDNGRVEITDAVVLLDFLFSRGPKPPPPFPARGFDPTPDAFPCGDGP